MRSVLVRYIDSRHIDSYKTGELYLSSLSSFWDLRAGNSGIALQQDFSEGVAAQVPHDVLDEHFSELFPGHIIHDARFRIEAYGYCNLLCFFRVDAIDTKNAVVIDKRYENLVRCNPMLSNNVNHVIQIPDEDMKGSRDMVILIRDEGKFVGKILDAVRKNGGECLIGDVRYHPMEDRLDSATLRKHHLTVVSDDSDLSSGLFDMDMFCSGRSDVKIYGSLDKYSKYSGQKEWRICWLPDIRNHEAKILPVGDINDIIEIMPAAELASKLQGVFSGYHFGYVNDVRKQTFGSMSHRNFRTKVESIDGKCRVIFDIG